jgi:hypothetical protein
MPQFKVNAHMYAQLIKLMLEGTYSCKELAEETGAHYVTVLEYTRELYRAKAAHICRWEKDIRGRDVIKIYKLGSGKDATRDKLTPVQRQRRAREKRKKMQELAVLAGTGRYVQSANGGLRFEPLGVST